MKLTKRFSAIIFAVMLVPCFTACNKNKDNRILDVSGSSSSQMTETLTRAEPDISGQTIIWLGTHDLNPTPDKPQRSSALAMFEDKYGAKIEYINTTDSEKYNTLSQLILGGTAVDMFEYDSNALPQGVESGLFQPIDDYIDLNDEIWNSVRGLSDTMTYKGKHYVIPCSVLPDTFLQYSRTLMKSEGLEDPYELYKSGQWTWSKFMEMMNSFVAKNPSDRYGITGWWQESAVQSCGSPIVKYDNEKFVNNINDPQLEKTGQLFEQINSVELYLHDEDWRGYFPNDNNVLFYAMGLWTLNQSNMQNPDGDIFIVPFPKEDNASTYCAAADISSYMLVRNSDKGNAVGLYLKCERLADTLPEYTDSARKKALQSGEMTTEQYDFIHSCFTDGILTPAFDFSYGMGNLMYGNGDYTFANKGAVNNISEAIFNEDVSSWTELRDTISPIIDESIAGFNQ